MNIKDKIASFGGPAALARILGISSQAVSQWDDIPLERAVELYKRKDCRLQPWEILPQVFDEPIE